MLPPRLLIFSAFRRRSRLVSPLGFMKRINVRPALTLPPTLPLALTLAFTLLLCWTLAPNLPISLTSTRTLNYSLPQ